jgi:hypothetical protein
LLFPHVFSRASGHTYICVSLNSEHRRLEPREFTEQVPPEGPYEIGYIIPGDDEIWDPQADLEGLPSAWLTTSVRHGTKVAKKYVGRMPQRISFDEKGNYEFNEESSLSLRGWFMSCAPQGLLFDPTAGLFFDGNTNERTKLTTLGNEGRSTSTTITSFLVLQGLAKHHFHVRDQKLLSFTDNRQDAALQSGHFNDFVRVVRIRAAIAKAVAEAGSLSFKDLGPRVRQALSLPLRSYARTDDPDPFPKVRQKYESIFDNYPPDIPRRLRDIYARCYALARLRRLSEHTHFADARHTDAWLALASLFRLFDESGAGKKIGIEPLGGDLFDSRSLGSLAEATLDNATLLGCLRRLTIFKHPDTGQRMRVNYAALNVEEFGSVYQGLLDFEPVIDIHNDEHVFRFAKGDERSKTGSHYTEEELVQPLLKHSLEHLIREIYEKHATAEARAKALLALKVCDVACGSGHILLAAARRIGVELAIVRTGDEQPSPAALREAIRDVIKNCIHGMDLNPLAVELCKVALWLEAHVPGQPLSFLDHRIKCGNAIVGLAHRAELQRGIPDEAFKTLTGDDKDLAAALRKRNKEERKGFQSLSFAGSVEQDIQALDRAYRDFENTEEHDAADYYHRREEYEKFRNDQRLRNLRLLADAQVAQFYLPKTPEYDGLHVTHDLYRKWLGGLHPTGKEIAAAQLIARRKSFAHWFIEFWDIVDAGGFDLILGNPPYLGGTKLSGNYGHEFCEWVKWEGTQTCNSPLTADWT